MELVIRSPADIKDHLDETRKNASAAVDVMRSLPTDPLEALFKMKFSPIGFHPIEGHKLNVIEQLNQTFTYIVALKATEILFGKHPNIEGYELWPGAHAPKNTLDIQSINPDLVGAETFAAVSPSNNNKLNNDLTKLAGRQEHFRYVFMMIPTLTETRRHTDKERDGVEVWSIWPFD